MVHHYPPVCAHYRKNLYFLILGSIHLMNPKWNQCTSNINMETTWVLRLRLIKKKIIIFCCLSGLWPGLVDMQDAFFEKLGPYILVTLHRVCAIVTGTLHTLFCSQWGWIVHILEKTTPSISQSLGRLAVHMQLLTDSGTTWFKPVLGLNICFYIPHSYDGEQCSVHVQTY